MSKRRFIRWLFIAIAAIGLRSSACVFADTFTVPLSLSSGTAPDGGYLSAAFDFGTAFSHIDSITLGFTIRSGFQGNATTTGNSSYFRDLYFVLHGATVPVIDAESGVTRSAFYVPATEPMQIDFGGFSTTFDGDIVEPEWPEFAYHGNGQLAFIDVFQSSYHPLPAGTIVSSTTSWLAPTEITGASLTIVGAPVPEPDVIRILAICGACCAAYSMRRRHRNVTDS